MKTKDMALVSLFVSLTTIGGLISIALGPISITFQSLFVLLSGLVLGPKLAAGSQILYILLGLMGLPIFSDHTGGFHVIFRPSFGFLIGFVFAAYFSGYIYRLNPKKPSNSLLASIGGTLLIYIFGLPYMYYALKTFAGLDVDLYFVIRYGFLLFIPGDIIKILMVRLLVQRIPRLIK